MSGQPGRSGGKPLGLAHHVLNGTYRKDRHGPRPDIVPAIPPGPAADWQPSKRDLQDLGRIGRAFVKEVLADNELSGTEGAILLAAARARDNAARWHVRSRAKGSGTLQARYARLALSFEKQHASLLAQLKVIAP